jgi:hypothetical protein
MPISADVPKYQIMDVVPLGNPTWIEGAGAFTDVAGTATNPTSATLTVVPPPESEVNPTTYSWPAGTPALAQEAAGRFYANHRVTVPGLWHYRLAGVGNVEQADEGRFWVEPSQVVNS